MCKPNSTNWNCQNWTTHLTQRLNKKNCRKFVKLTSKILDAANKIGTLESISILSTQVSYTQSLLTRSVFPQKEDCTNKLDLIAKICRHRRLFDNLLKLFFFSIFGIQIVSKTGFCEQ